VLVRLQKGDRSRAPIPARIHLSRGSAHLPTSAPGLGSPLPPCGSTWTALLKKRRRISRTTCGLPHSAACCTHCAAQALFSYRESPCVILAINTLDEAEQQVFWRQLSVRMQRSPWQRTRTCNAINRLGSVRPSHRTSASPRYSAHPHVLPDGSSAAQLYAAQRSAGKAKLTARALSNSTNERIVRRCAAFGAHRVRRR
jgi:hypothetical protein